MIMRTDMELKSEVMERIDSIPALNTSDIEVLVDDGFVKLNGEVNSNQLRFQVERTARRVIGMRGLEINIRSNQAMLRKSHTKEVREGKNIY